MNVTKVAEHLEAEGIIPKPPTFANINDAKAHVTKLEAELAKVEHAVKTARTEHDAVVAEANRMMNESGDNLNILVESEWKARGDLFEARGIVQDLEGEASVEEANALVTEKYEKADFHLHLTADLVKAIRGKYADSWTTIIIDQLQQRQKYGGFAKVSLQLLEDPIGRKLSSKQVERAWATLFGLCTDRGFTTEGHYLLGTPYRCHVENHIVKRSVKKPAEQETTDCIMCSENEPLQNLDEDGVCNREECKREFGESEVVR